MPSLIIEGPDGAGKSTLAEFISSARGIPLVPSSFGPPKDIKALLERTFYQLEQPGILDRCSLISEIVYGECARDISWYTYKWLSLLPCPIIYCRPARITILSTKLQIKPHKDEKHLIRVKDTINSIISKYDKLMEYIYQKKLAEVIYYNRDIVTMEDFLPCVESILHTEKQTSVK